MKQDDRGTLTGLDYMETCSVSGDISMLPRTGNPDRRLGIGDSHYDAVAPPSERPLKACLVFSNSAIASVGP